MTAENAAVICRQQGLGVPVSFRTGAFVSEVSIFAVHGLSCRGTESTIWDCELNEDVREPCAADEYV